jgi:hypothetical protein
VVEDHLAYGFAGGQLLEDRAPLRVPIEQDVALGRVEASEGVGEPRRRDSRVLHDTAASSETGAVRKTYHVTGVPRRNRRRNSWVFSPFHIRS